MKMCYSVLIILLAMAGSVFAQQISDGQQKELTAIGLEFAEKAIQLESQLQNNLSELALELTREGRLDSETTAKESAKRVNTILTYRGTLYGDFIQTKVAYMLKAKNVLTREQKLEMLSQLEPADVMDYGQTGFLQPDIFDLPINLDTGQREKIINLKADLLVKEVRLERDIELTLLKIETALLAETIDPAKVDKQVMALAKLAAKAIENRVTFVLDAKDTLTLDQKRQLAELIVLD